MRLVLYTLDEWAALDEHGVRWVRDECVSSFEECAYCLAIVAYGWRDTLRQEVACDTCVKEVEHA